MSPATETCLQEPPQTADSASDPKNLWRRYHPAHYGADIENQLVTEYLPLMKSVVARIAVSLPNHIQKEELYSPAMVGLLKAVRNYDPANNTSFEAYARHRIRGAVLDELRKLDWVPRSVHEKAKRVQRTLGELEQRLGRVPTEREAADAMNLSESDYAKLLDQIRPASFVSLDAAIESDGDAPAAGLSVKDDHAKDPREEASKHELVALISERIQELPDNMRKVLAFYYFENMRLREIAEIFGVTESRISQIHTQAIIMIRASFQNQT